MGFLSHLHLFCLENIRKHLKVEHGGRAPGVQPLSFAHVVRGPLHVLECVYVPNTFLVACSLVFHGGLFLAHVPVVVAAAWYAFISICLTHVFDIFCNDIYWFEHILLVNTKGLGMAKLRCKPSPTNAHTFTLTSIHTK